MENEKNLDENVDSPNDNENENSEENNENENEGDDVTQKLTELEEKNKQLFTRAKKAEDEVKKLRDTSQKPKGEEVSKVENTSLDEEWKQKIELITEHKLTPDRAAKVIAYAKSQSISTKEALEDDFVKAAFKEMDRKAKSDKASPDSGDKSPVFKNYTEGDLKKMSREELEKILPHA